MRKILLVLFVFAAISAFAADTAVKGYLVDLSCGREEGSRADFGAKHNKMCLQMPNCANSGYGVLTDDKRIIAFDAAGNTQAKKFIAGISKKLDIKVTVTGDVQGDQIAVSKIELQ